MTPWWFPNAVVVGFGLLAVCIGTADAWWFHGFQDELRTAMIVGGFGVGGVSVAHGVGKLAPQP